MSDARTWGRRIPVVGVRLHAKAFHLRLDHQNMRGYFKETGRECTANLYQVGRNWRTMSVHDRFGPTVPLLDQILAPNATSVVHFSDTTLNDTVTKASADMPQTTKKLRDIAVMTYRNYKKLGVVYSRQRRQATWGDCAASARSSVVCQRPPFSPGLCAASGFPSQFYGTKNQRQTKYAFVSN